ncbi:4Fe-4S dicluster domain-containing protein [Methanoregula formicica]|uniref:Dissimilatory sulfite reductase (Desulfoviridin), alpha/beta subunit n=1 Tax=Methanoregula formicica (strain DSM 22288 / NBRC 105244 / SMSP) TaxID=593750 RepID=L0HAJ2_METFS|nr:4Fe-4S dicluster domain-containing protein [Methanoregula formicica]AGB01747.1 dissimilatory sulfite reductase (desulfoviridin), alpha/beta subunit [Methanoregula formicica SMSP]
MQRDIGIHMKGGVITERNPDLSTIRIRAPAGILSVEQLRGIAKIAKTYGSGEVHCTTRQTIEIPHVDPKHLKKMALALEKNGTPVGSERDEIVNIISCPGTERCKFANIDTISLTQKIDAKLFGKVMPVKMRIALSGCPNACTSPMLNEIGVIGRVRPVRTKERICTGCGSCVFYCKEGAIRIKNGISVLDENKCVECGVCVQSCSFDLVKAEDRHFLITVGGRRGRHPKVGRKLLTVKTEEQVLFVIEKIVDWVYRRAWSGRLLSEQLDDLHFEKFREEILRQVPEARSAEDAGKP